MNLAIFDIDGTLTNTNEVDQACFLKAWKDLFRITDVPTDWSKYRYSTDSGIADELFEKYHLKTSNDIEHFRNYFVECLRKAHREDPSSFIEVKGASNLIDRLRLHPDWKLAIATGAWKKSAEFKLERSEIRFGDIPFGCAEDAFDRKDIILKAWQDAERIHSVKAFDRVIYVGDGIWDLKAAAELKIPFVGISAKEHFHFRTLRHQLADYLDQSKVLRYFSEAEVAKF